MKSETPLHAEHQLDQLAGQFERWRQSRAHPRERIPQPLWDQAVDLTPALSPSRVAKYLRLSWADLTHHIALHHEQVVSPPTPGFVELPPEPSWSQPRGGLEVELHRVDGARLRIHAPDASLPLAALVRSFLEAR